MRKELGGFADDHALPPFVESLKAEILQNVCSVASMPEYHGIMTHVNRRAEERGEEAWNGQFAATLYQDEERKCLEVIVDEIERIAQERRIEHPIGSLIHDGLTVRKELEIGSYRERLERRITGATRYTLRLEIKPMEVSLEERVAYVGAQPLDMSYEAMKTRFEARRFKTEAGKSPFHAIDLRTGDIVSRTKDAFTVAFEDWIPDGGRQFLEAWYSLLTRGVRLHEHQEHLGAPKCPSPESCPSSWGPRRGAKAPLLSPVRRTGREISPRVALDLRVACAPSGCWLE
jgi:hypothetical protein